MNYVVTFDGLKCEIQDLRTRKMIGLARLFEGLYYMETDSRTVNTTRSEQEETIFLPHSALWHFRLGHLSNHRIQKLQSIFPFVNIDD